MHIRQSVSNRITAVANSDGSSSTVFDILSPPDCQDPDSTGDPAERLLQNSPSSRPDSTGSALWI
jgi:hypothetical protein